MMCASALLVKWPLGGLAAGEFLGGPATVGADPLQAQFQRGIDEDHPVADGTQPRLQEERCVDNEGARPGRRGGEELLAVALDPRMDQRFQALAVAEGGEHQLPEPRAIDGAVRRAHAVAPPREDLGADGRVVQRLARERIAVADQAAFLREDARDGGLPGADAAGEAEGGQTR